MLLNALIKFVFLSFSFIFFDEVSNFRNIILTTQKRELVVSNCQWDCNVSIVLLLIGRIAKPPTTDRPLTNDSRPPTHQQDLHWPTNHQQPAHWQILHQPTNSSAHRAPTHQLSWILTLRLTKVILTESPLDQFFHYLISVRHSDCVLFITEFKTLFIKFVKKERW